MLLLHQLENQDFATDITGRAGNTDSPTLF